MKCLLVEIYKLQIVEIFSYIHLRVELNAGTVEKCCFY